jgi:hypothetical protein
MVADEDDNGRNGIEPHGWTAFVLSCWYFCLGIVGGLMALIFYSAHGATTTAGHSGALNPNPPD